MKYCVIIPDGMADFPVSRLENRTPLEAARKPNMDRAAAEGLLGQVRTVPGRMTPGSDIAIMSVMGYDPLRYHTGRGPLEAADMNVELAGDDWAFRCNLITSDGEAIVDFTAGHITNPEAEVLIQALNRELGNKDIEFHVGTSYRHLMVYRGSEYLSLETRPPHDVVGEPIVQNLPRGSGAKMLTDLMNRSVNVLADHEVNKVRLDLGQNPANMIWLWGEGRRPDLEPFASRFGCRGAIISAVNLVRGIARLIGWEVIPVPGATGYVDTDYAAKGRYAVDGLKSYDLVLVHVEAPDEASHEGDLKAKIRAIEQVDQEILGPVMAASADYPDLRVMVLPDHVTSVEQRKHVRGLVPFAMWGAGIDARSGLGFAERTAAQTEVVCEQGHELMGSFLRT